RLLPDYLPADAVLALVDPKRTGDRAEEVRAPAEEAAQASWTAAAEGGRPPVEGAGYRPLADVLAGSGRPVLRVGPFDPGGSRVVRIDAHAIEPYRANVTRVAADARALAADGYTVLLTTEGAGPAERLRDVLRDDGLPVPLAAEPPEAGVAVGTAALLNGFRLPELRLALIAEGDLYGTRRQTRDQARMPATRRRDKHAGGAVALDELQPGDIVVHAVHGIARYVGMEHRTVGGAERDYLLLAYDQGDRLYLPSEQVQMISRYVGGESPKLSRLGSREWDRQKARVRRKVREMAAELVRLYSARMASPGHAFGPDTPWQRELEDAFPFAETPDQLAAVEQIKADMEVPVPMDRLLCGDVGYGKTEVAVRAAFKAVMDGKQVAVLVPTTLLAQQHLAIFSERFAPFPVKVGMLSRFASRQEQEAVVAAMADGTMDVVIGTHRLLSADAKWADLGLAVVDEEHRFGVAHKERMKQLRASVDVLALTATPIPRTLYMSLSGVRDMSVIETPPLDRLPIETVVRRFSKAVIKEALERELGRGGQVFFVHNRVQSLVSMARFIQELVPQARVIMGHGQMGERELEATMVRFVSGQADILVSTAIVESGLDIPASNTIIINRADRFGLAQLYQLRGRVGRERLQAYCYLLVPADGRVDEQAQRRLRALQELTELGSGFKLALRDLEIRGAGNLLGAQQHGHIAAVGYDLYSKLLAEAVQELRGDRTGVAVEPVISVQVEGFLPEDYVPEVNQRLALYKRLAGVASADELADLRSELLDRFGSLPEPAEQLIDIVRIRIEARALGIERLEAGEGKAVITFAPGTAVQPEHLVSAIQASRGRLRMRREFTLEATISKGGWAAVRDSLLGVLAGFVRS
ncbi:MAG TPA: transcription-repair coupling factor, partial [Methylomirabilota bacterium]|nr:transcription-repair coupling factor [Methylomirabilota bacterium]